MAIELLDPNQPRNKRAQLLAIYGAIVLVLLGGTYSIVSAVSGSSFEQPEYLQCIQPQSLEPEYHALGFKSSSEFLTPQYREKSVKLLAGAVQIPTVSFDDMDMDVENEPRFKVFFQLHRYLKKHFPLLWERVEKVNTYGLLYTIEGTDPSLKPLLIMAHQDVVPVAPETEYQWTHDPFSGEFDGEFLNGRGACDTKNSLIASHESVEALLSQGWKPKRTLLMSFGFDEEIQGWRGARKLAERIEERYGQDSIEMLIDEGFGFTNEYNRLFASPAVAEKGRVNYKVTLNTPGGHSSMPPDHTGIGIMAQLITLLEDDVPLSPELQKDLDVVKAKYSCIGHYGNDDLSSSLRNVYKNLGSEKSDKKLTEMLASDITTRILVETTQAIDLISGGVKINALPEEVTMEVNYRIKPASSIDKETHRFLERVKEIASNFNLAVNYTNTVQKWDEQVVIVPPPQDVQGTVLVETTDMLEVAPISPFYNDIHWELIGGTVKHVLEDVLPDFDRLHTVLSPGLMTGNTDTAHYWNLTSNIYRFIPALMEDMRSIHTVNEGLRVRSHLSTVVFFYEFLLNADSQL